MRVERFGCLDTKGIYYACRRSELEKFKMYEQEDAQKLMKEQSDKVCLFDYTADQSHTASQQFSVSIVIDIWHILIFAIVSCRCRWGRK